jgi:hypothetical protein
MNLEYLHSMGLRRPVDGIPAKKKNRRGVKVGELVATDGALSLDNMVSIAAGNQ